MGMGCCACMRGQQAASQCQGVAVRYAPAPRSEHRAESPQKSGVLDLLREERERNWRRAIVMTHACAVHRACGSRSSGRM